MPTMTFSPTQAPSSSPTHITDSPSEQFGIGGATLETSIDTVDSSVVSNLSHASAPRKTAGLKWRFSDGMRTTVAVLQVGALSEQVFLMNARQVATTDELEGLEVRCA